MGINDHKPSLKPVNLVKAGYSYLKSSVTGKADIKGMPVSVSMELTNNCNLSCPHCSSGSGTDDKRAGDSWILNFSGK